MLGKMCWRVNGGNKREFVKAMGGETCDGEQNPSEGGFVAKGKTVSGFFSEVTTHLHLGSFFQMQLEVGTRHSRHSHGARIDGSTMIPVSVLYIVSRRRDMADLFRNGVGHVLMSRSILSYRRCACRQGMDLETF